jgi:hypothetical protein
MEENLVDEDQVKASEADGGYQIVPRWIDTSGRTRSWTLVSPAGDRLADTTTKRGAENLIHLLSRAKGIAWDVR